MLDIKALEAAFARIGEIGKGEIAVEVDGVHVVLRTLTPDEDVEVQRYARGTDVDETDNITLIERFKRATIAYSVVEVGGLNLRGVTSVATGEVLPGGVPVRVPKHEAILRITSGWSRHATTIVFQEYAELVKRAEDDANSRVLFDGARVDAEIERLESRLADLRRMQLAAANPSAAAGATATVAAAEAALSRTAIPPAPAGGPEAPPAPRQRITPPAAPPPPAPPAPPDIPPGASPLPAEVHSSVGDFSPEDIAAEETRIAELRSRRAAQADMPSPISVRHGRVPPHMAARAAAEAPALLENAVAVDPVGDVETYRMPAVNLSDRGRGSNAPPAPVRGGPIGQRVPASAVNPRPAGGPTNPNFRGGPTR